MNVNAGFDSIVYYVLDVGNNVGYYRPAIVTRSLDNGVVNLRVFGDGPQDGPPFADGVTYRDGVPHDATGTKPGTWHYLGDVATGSTSAPSATTVVPESAEGEVAPGIENRPTMVQQEQETTLETADENVETAQEEDTITQ